MTLTLDSHARAERLLMALHDTKHSNIRRTRRKQKGVRRERLNLTEGPQFEVTGTLLILFVTALLTLAYFAGLLPDP